MIRRRRRKPASAEYVFQHSIDLSSGVGFNLQETGGVITYAYNTKFDLGRDIALNGQFANWTGVDPDEEPDDWTVGVTGGADASNKVVENPAGQCQMISDGTLVQIKQAVLAIGKTYTITIDVKAVDVVGNGITVQMGGAGTQLNITTTGVKTLSGTAVGTDVLIKRGGAATDVTFDDVTCKQTNILASSVYAPGTNPLDGAVTGATPGTKGGGPIRYMWSFDGAAALINRLSAEYNSLQSPLAFTKSVAIRKSTWDTTERYILHDYIDADNWDAIYTSTTQDQVVFEHRAGGTTEQITWDSSGATDIIVLDIGVGSTTFKARVNGVNVGSESVAGTQIGNLTVALIGAATITTKVHLGDAAYAENVNTYVPDAEMLRIVRSLIG